MFLVISVVLTVLVVIFAFFFIRRMLKFFHLDSKGRGVKAANVVLAAFVGYMCRSLRNLSTMAVLHVIVISLCMDLLALVIRAVCRGRQKGKCYIYSSKVYRSGIVPIAVTAILFIYGAVNMNHIQRAQYDLQTEKQVGNYKLVMITDTHYATIQDTGILKSKIEEINREKSDIVVLGGDIVEEGTPKEKMQEVFVVLGGIESRYGIYYVYGNHDRQPYTQQPSYTPLELEQAIEDNGIIILEDEYTQINGELVLAGRADAAWGNSSGRLTAEQLLDGADRDKYIVVADHQPIEAKENDLQGADLEISGHTHAGQIWPIGHFTELTGGLNYGEYQEGECKVIVSSGFTGWGYPIRTQGHCEYVVVNISGK